MRRQVSRAPWALFHRSLTSTILCLGLCSWPCMCLAMTPPTTELAEDHRALLPDSAIKAIGARPTEAAQKFLKQDEDDTTRRREVKATENA